MATMTRAELAEAVAVANVPTLLMVLVQLTGELRWLEEPYRPAPGRGVSDNDTGGLPEPVQQEVRAAAADAIARWQSDGTIALEQPAPELLVRMLSVSMAEQVPDDYSAMLADELAPRIPDVRRDLDGRTDLAAEAAPGAVDVIVVGAGLSGICAGVRLAEAGFSCTILESADRLGGTWRDNRYPAAAVDTPSHLYSFSFAPHDWPRHFGRQDQILEYLEQVAKDFGVLPHIRFGTRVAGATFDAADRSWLVEVVGADGSTRTVRARILISAVGAFNPPKLPEIPGLDEFEGAAFHTAAWPDDYVVDGRDVAVIGNGASAMQVVPAIAPNVRSLTVFQRSPHWVAPFEKFQREVPTAVRRLLAEVPLYARWYRVRLGWLFNDKLYPVVRRDPQWPHPERAMNAVSDRYREFLTRYLTQRLGDRQDLREQVLPTYPPGGKRLLLDNGWFETLQRPNVTLVTSAVTGVDAAGLTTADGSRYDVDTIVLATGFEAARFLSGIDVRGRDGRLLDEVWEGDNGKAYRGVAVPGFPNFFVLYGPNSQTGHGGSLISLVELQIHYVVSLLIGMRDAGARSIEVTQEAHDEYNALVDRMHQDLVWTHPGMRTYHRNSRGRVVVATPFRMVDLWRDSRRVDLENYVTQD